MLDPLARPPLQMATLLNALRKHGVDWVLSGSTVLAVYGAEVAPNDLDVVPSPDAGNLRRIANLLMRLRAIPAHFPSWAGTLSVAECRAWSPEPPTLERLDHLFVTCVGMLDIPPEITGSYAQLRAGATELELFGVGVWVCDPDEVFSRLPDQQRLKDQHRAQTYAAVRERLRTDRRPHGLDRFQ